MIKKLFNPYIFIAGGASLFIGLAVILATSIIGHFSNIHFPDVLSAKVSPGFPLHFCIAQNLINWIITSLIMYLIAAPFSKTTVRIIDIAGTFALARAPYLIAATIGFFPALQNFGQYILWKTMKQGNPMIMSPGSITLAIFLIIIMLLLTIWMVTLMYNGFKISANLKEPKSALLFVTGLVLSIIATLIINNQLYHILIHTS
ncbi:MAG: hypothetical protein PF489_01665 [Salinivirgaceae bacterium]|jgi:hypothetical protein|nr:hypothetical protein [Salinivirgaceae bacterium]